MARPLLAAIALVAAATLVACAEGSEISDLTGAGGSLPSGSGGASGLGGGGGDDEGSTARASSSASGPSTSAGATTSSGGDGGAGEGGGGDGGAGATTGATTSATTTTGSGVLCDFTSPNDCAGAENLGAVAGDEDGAPVVVEGTTSKWFQIRIEERSSGISETDLSYSVSLTSPAGMNYDLYVLQGPQDGNPDCGAGPTVGQSNGVAEVVSASWDDDQGFGGEDDSLWLSIEVRHLSGEMCDLDDRWTLSIQGDP